MQHRLRSSSQSGFGLLEVVFAVLILSLVSVGFLSIVSMQRAQKMELVQEEKRNVVRNAIAEYIKEDPSNPIDVINYPCAADPSAAFGSSDFGVEQRDASGNCRATGAITMVGGTAGRPVFIGALPTKTLGISDAYAMDVYNRQLTYAVSGDVALPDALVAGNIVTGSITIRNGDASAPITTQNAPFVFLSHGKDGTGSYTSRGTPYAETCSDSSVGDSENCNNDAVFALLERSTAGTAEQFDDAVEFDIADMRVTIEDCPIGSQMIGISKGKPVCQELTVTCPPNEFLVGLTRGQPICQSMAGSLPGGGNASSTRVQATGSGSIPNTTTRSAAISRSTGSSSSSRSTGSSSRSTASSSSTPDEGWLGSVYRETLGRAPDNAGTEFWLSQEQSGMSRSDIAAHIKTSCEATGSCHSTSAGQQELAGQASTASSYEATTGQSASGRSTEAAAKTSAATSTAQYNNNQYYKPTTRVGVATPSAASKTYTNTYKNTYTNTYTNPYTTDR